MSVARRVLVTLSSALIAFGGVSVVQLQSAAAKPPRTVKKIVRPVHRNGTPVRGYRVTWEYSHDPEYYDCTYRSPVAVSANIAWCGGTADNTIACWKSTDYTVLCLRNPRKRELVRIPYSGAFYHGRAPKRPGPQYLKLRKFGACTVRLGGAWDTVKKHPDWYGAFSCSSKKRGSTAVYGGPKDRDGINVRKRPWRVHILAYPHGYDHAQRIYSDRVKTAYYVGTAR